MNKMPIGIQTFDEIIQKKYVYIDKTSFIYSLASVGKCYFLSRPRRFGKSLLVSTLKAYFLGKKDLFENLAAAKLESDWIEHPVLHLDLSAGLFENRQELENLLNVKIKEYESIWGKDESEITISMRFAGVIKRAYQKTGSKVVVLIDEYDKPLLYSIEKDIIHEDIKNLLKIFFSVLKSSDQYLRFVFLTGVTKFSQVSVFSDLNQLRDISMEDAFTSICGITETELLDNFKPELEALAQKKGAAFDEILAELRKNYNGYHFSKNSAGVFNPFSLLNTFAKQDIDYYWFATGTPTFLTDALVRNDFDISLLENGITISRQAINDYRPGATDIIPILYQTGYLTIQSYNEEFDEYILTFPNKEVEYGFLKELFPYYVPKPNDRQGLWASNFVRDLQSGGIEGFMRRIEAFFAAMPYDLMRKSREIFFQTACYILFTLMGQFTQVEVKSAQGRADMVVSTKSAVYVFEFKMADSGTAESALKQIDDKGYLIPYAAGGKKLVKIGVVFDQEKRNISDWKAV